MECGIESVSVEEPKNSQSRLVDDPDPNSEWLYKSESFPHPSGALQIELMLP
jgi:hypothetical protein